MHPFIQVGFLGVDVAIEMDDAHLFIAQVAADAAHGGKADRMVAAENDREGTAGKNMGDALGNLIEALLVVGGNGEDIAHIAKANLFAQIDAHLIVVGRVEG